MKKNKRLIIIGTIIALLITCIMGIFLYSHNEKTKDISYNEFLEMLNNHEIKSVKIDGNNEDMKVYDLNEQSYTTTYPDYEMFKVELLKNNVEIVYGNTLYNYIYYIIIFFSLRLMFYMMIELKKDDKSIANKYKIEETNDISFDCIGGLHDIKKELYQLIQMVKQPDCYLKLGIKYPKGLLL